MNDMTVKRRLEVGSRKSKDLMHMLYHMLKSWNSSLETILKTFGLPSSDFQLNKYSSKIIGTLLLTAFLISATSTSNGQDKSEFTMKEAQTYALENNGKVKNAKLDLQIAEKKVWETTAIGLPQVSASGAFQNFMDIPTSVIPANSFDASAPDDAILEMRFGTDYTMNGGLQVNQLIFSGNYLVAIQATQAFLAVSQNVITKNEIDVKHLVAEAYITVLVLEANKKILTSTLESIESIYSDTKILVEEKVIEAINANQIELSVLQTKNGLTKVESQVEGAKDFLKLHMGMDLNADIKLTENIDVFLAQTEKVEDTKLNPESTIDHQILASQLTLNKLALKNTKANYLPNLAAFFSHQQTALRNEFNITDSDQNLYPTTIWGINLSIPIFSSGQRASQVSQAKLEVLKTQNTIEQADKGIALQISTATSDLNRAREVFKTEKRAIEVAKKVLDNTEIKFKEGLVSSMELTQAQSQYLVAQSNGVRATYNLLKAKFSIDKLSNKL